MGQEDDLQNVIDTFIPTKLEVFASIEDKVVL